MEDSLERVRYECDINMYGTEEAGREDEAKLVVDGSCG